MARVFCKITFITLPGDYEDENGQTVEIDSVRVECVKCGNGVDIYGDSEASETAGMATLRATCPRGESNYYMKGKAW